MTRSINQHTVIGHLGGDPALRHTKNGTPVAAFTVATNRAWKNAAGERQEHTDWHHVVTFARLAEIVAEYLKQGTQVYVQGESRTESWEKDGQTHYRTRLYCRELVMLTPKAKDDAVADDEEPPEDAELEDDLPF